jgi:hypothetical protein
VASCKDVCGFLGQVSSRAVTAPLADADTGRLGQLGLVQVLTADQYRALGQELSTLGATQAGLGEEDAQRVALARQLSREYGRDHSILFGLHGKATRDADRRQEEQDRERLEAVDADLTQKEAAFNALLAKRAVYDGLTPLGDRFVALTTSGAVTLRDLTVRLYRYGETDFETYLAQAQRIDQELDGLATGGSAYFSGLTTQIPGADRAYLWAIGIGLAKAQPDPNAGIPRFVDAYRATADLSKNAENRLMSSEILVALPRALPDELAPLGELVRQVHKIGVPSESALGVASIVLFGQRADGSFATDTVRQFLRETRSYESAALLGITNVATDRLAEKFQAYRTLFGNWGYETSEDTELSAAYLAVSEFAPEDVGSKLAILARGLAAYLAYPLVAAAILSSIPTLEANETLNVVEKAYAVVGRRAAGLNQTELICLAVRMVHGIRNELVGNLDTTATAAAAARPSGFVGYGPRPIFMPLVIVHGGYYSTFGGISGVHPGHVHGMPTGFGGAGVG